MSMLGQVKCASCDRRYSGFHSRCPFCGARRIGRGKYAPENDNSTGKMLISILIMVVLVAAVIVLLVSRDDVTEPEPEVNSPIVEPSPLIPNDGSNESFEGMPAETGEPEASETPAETPTPVAVVESVTILYRGSQIKDNDFTMFMTDPQLPLTVKIVPEEVETDIEWFSTNSAVFEVVATDTTGKAAKVTPIGTGTATLKVTAGDVTAECIVRVRSK